MGRAEGGVEGDVQAEGVGEAEGGLKCVARERPRWCSTQTQTHTHTQRNTHTKYTHTHIFSLLLSRSGRGQRRWII